MLQAAVTVASLGAGSVCLALYVWQTVRSILAKPPATGAKGVTIDDAVKLVDSFAKLTEALTKAGPALTSLIASFLFFAIAAVSSSGLHS